MKPEDSAFARPIGVYKTDEVGASQHNSAELGLNVRDYIAIQAMTAMLTGTGFVCGEITLNTLTTQAYNIADKMIEQSCK